MQGIGAKPLKKKKDFCQVGSELARLFHERPLMLAAPNPAASSQRDPEKELVLKTLTVVWGWGGAGEGGFFCGSCPNLPSTYSHPW